jgi:hypothetical protein
MTMTFDFMNSGEVLLLCIANPKIRTEYRVEDVLAIWHSGLACVRILQPWVPSSNGFGIICLQWFE